MRGLCLRTIGFFLLLGLVVWGFAHAGAGDTAIVFRVIGFALIAGPWVFFWLARPRRTSLARPVWRPGDQR